VTAVRTADTSERRLIKPVRVALGAGALNGFSILTYLGLFVNLTEHGFLKQQS
jgi:hypothetical protein